MRSARVAITLVAALTLNLGCASRSVVPTTSPISAPTPTAPTVEVEVPETIRLGPHELPQIRWRVQTGGRIVATPIELPGGDIVVGSLDGKLYRVTANGRLVYSIDTGAPIRARALALTDETVLVGNDNGSLLRLDPKGEILWRTQLQGPIAADPIAGSDHAVYVAADGIYAFDAAGNVLWHHVEATTLYETPEWDARGHLNFRTVDGRVVVIDTRGQVQSTTRATPPEAPSKPPRATLDAAGIAYVVGPDQVLRATRDDGSELWGYSLGVNVTASVLLAASGTLLIGTDDGILYALQ